MEGNGEESGLLLPVIDWTDYIYVDMGVSGMRKALTIPYHQPFPRTTQTTLPTRQQQLLDSPSQDTGPRSKLQASSTPTRPTRATAMPTAVTAKKHDQQTRRNPRRDRSRRPPFPTRGMAAIKYTHPANIKHPPTIYPGPAQPHPSRYLDSGLTIGNDNDKNSNQHQTRIVIHDSGKCLDTSSAKRV